MLITDKKESHVIICHQFQETAEMRLSEMWKKKVKIALFKQKYNIPFHKDGKQTS